MRALFLLILCICLCTFSFSQHAQEDFRIELSKQRVANPFYNKLTILDSRQDTTDMGFVLTGETNRKSKVTTTVPLSVQLSHVFTELQDQNAKGGELLLQLRRLQFYQLLGAGNEKGYCAVRISLYWKNGSGYALLQLNDTLLQVKAADARRPLFEKPGEFLTNCIARHLSDNTNTENSFILADIIAIDSVEKKQIPVYNTSGYTDVITSIFLRLKTGDRKDLLQWK